MDSPEFARRSRAAASEARDLVRDIEVEKVFNDLGLLFEKTLGNKRLSDMWTNLKLDTLSSGSDHTVEQRLTLFRRMRDAVASERTAPAATRHKALAELDKVIERFDPKRPPAQA
ncbi:MAG TPA: hypothetical protein VMU11_04045 [Verrucomicrobiae bacterium]|nr:hypothetical protein [Verrucomicrobiae bacterium]